MKAEIASWVILLTSLTGMVFSVAGFIPSYWLEQEFTLNVNATGLSKDSQLANLFIDNETLTDGTKLPIKTSSKLGLFRKCTTNKIDHAGMTKQSNSECGTDEAQHNWQKIAFWLMAAALGVSAVELLLCVLVTCVKRCQRKNGVRVAIVLGNFLAASLTVITLILYVRNKKIQVQSPLPTRVDYELGGSYKIAGVGACVRSLLVLFNILHLIWYDDTASYKKFAGETIRMESLHAYID